jgi:uncharacterized protein
MPHADGSDASNARAKTVLSSGEPLLTTDHIVVETWTFIRHRLRRRPAERFWEGIRLGAAAVERWEWRISTRLGRSENPIDQDFSIVDRTSFAVMRRLGIECAARACGAWAGGYPTGE